MVRASGSHFKFVYTNWLTVGTESVPIANGINPIGVRKLREVAVDPNLLCFINQNAYEEKVLSKHPEFDLFYMLGHSLLIHYLDCYYPKSCFVREDQIEDDDDIYLFILETNKGNYTLYNEYTVTVDGTTTSCSVRDIFSESILAHLKTGKVKLVINNIQDPCPAPRELIKLYKILHDLKIPFNHMIIISGNKSTNCDAVIPGILSLYEGNKMLDTYPRQTHLGYVSDIVRKKDLNPDIIRSRKFICFNRNLEKHHRIYLAYLAFKHNLFDVGYFSFLNISNPYQIDVFMNQLKKEACILDSDDDPDLIATLIKNKIPIQLDTHHLQKHELGGFGTVDNYKKEFYINSYIHLVSETTMSNEQYSPFFSEKTVRPIMNLQPFVYFGDYMALAKLKDLGFKTFHPFIDESYDLEKNPYLRMKMLGEQVLNLNNMPVEKIHQWYYSITDIMIHNQNNLRNFSHHDVFKSVLEKIKKDYT